MLFGKHHKIYLTSNILLLPCWCHAFVLFVWEFCLSFLVFFSVYRDVYMGLTVFLLDHYSLSPLYFTHIDTRFQAHGTRHTPQCLIYVLVLMFLIINPWPCFDDVISTLGFLLTFLNQIICNLPSDDNPELKIYWIMLFIDMKNKILY